MNSPYRILVVCTGNICRSPMGEVVLREKLAQAGIANSEVKSAAVSAEEQGNPIDSRAQLVLREAGYTVPRRSAHRATEKELQEADLILAMTVGHAHALRRMMNEAGADLAKLHLWREYDGTAPYCPNGVFGTGGVLENLERCRKRSRYSDFYTSDGEYDVPDPWYGGQEGFYETLTVIERGADGIITAEINK
ncbi:low molecular weight protein-tyrosine-phosphatase [Arcanobacterium hippocoleae]